MGVFFGANSLKPWDAVPHPASLLLLRNFATQNGYAAASIFAVPKRLDLNFNKKLSFLLSTEGFYQSLD